MTKQHTPGPWVVGEHGTINASGRLIATTALYGDDEDEPNMDLLALAPELLRVAKFALQCGDWPPETREEIREIIKKAKGEE